MIQADLAGQVGNPLDTIKGAMHNLFNFDVIMSDQIEKDSEYRNRLVEVIQNSIFCIVLLDSLTPSLAFEYGLAASLHKPLIVLRSQIIYVDIPSSYTGMVTDEKPALPKPGQKPNYQAFLPGLIEEQIIIYNPNDPEDLTSRLVREIAINRHAISDEIEEMGRQVPSDLYTQILAYLDGEERKKILGEALQKFPTDKGLYIMAGKIKLKENDLFGAAKDFERAVQLNPNDPDAHMRKGEAYYELGQFPIAAQDFGRAIQLQPVNPGAYYNKGNAHFYMDEEAEAEFSYSVAVEQKPDFANALNNQASIQINRGNYAGAVKMLMQAIDKHPTYAFSYFNLARAYRGMKKPGGVVLRNLERSAKMAISNLRSGQEIKRNTFCLFLVYAALGERATALEYLHKCTTYDLPLKSWKIADKS